MVRLIGIPQLIFEPVVAGRGADCWGEWLPSARERPVDLRKKGVYSSYTYHTAGNLPFWDCKEKTVDEIVDVSMGAQVDAAAADSLGICIFGRSVTDSNHGFIVDELNDAHGTDLDASFLFAMGKETLELEHEHEHQHETRTQTRNSTWAAGFRHPAINDLPAIFFYEESG